MKLLKYILFVLVFSFSLKLEAKNYVVSSSSELQAALDDLEGRSGDHEVFIMNGTYTPSSGFELDCDGSEDSVLIYSGLATFNATLSDELFYIRDCKNITLEGIQVSETTVTGNSILYFSSCTNATLDNVTLHDNKSENGMVYFAGSSTKATIKDGLFYRNEITGASSEKIVQSDYVLKIQDSSFYSHEGAFGLLSADQLTLTSTTIRNNTLDGPTASVNMVSALQVDITDSTLEVNTIDGHVVFTTSSTSTIDSSTLRANEAGGVVLFNGALEVTDSTLEDNVTQYGVIKASSAATSLKISGSTFDSNILNEDGVNGGVIYSNISGVTFEISDSVFSNNTANTFGGGIAISDATSVSMDSSIFKDNTAESGGGALYINDVTTTDIHNSSFISNESGSSAGAIYFVAISSAMDADISSTTFYNNQATQNGGALQISGASSSIKVSLQLANVSMAQNRAQSNGGAIYVDSESSAHIDHTTIAYNSALNSGGGFYSDGIVYLSNTIIGDNAAIDNDDCDADYVDLNGYNIISDVSDDCITSTPGSTDLVDTDPLLIPDFYSITTGSLTHYYYNFYVESPAVNLVFGSCSVTLADGTTSYDDQIGNRRGTVECDAGSIENQCDSSDSDYATYYADTDEDGYGDNNNTLSCCGCEQPSGYVTDNHDCDDTDASDTPIRYRDADEDSYGDSSNTAFVDCLTGFKLGYVKNDEDCDDTDDTLNPEALEVCDDIDNDCNGSIDDNATDASTWYKDADRDTYGTSSTTKIACDKPSGYVAVSGDCKDSNKFINPGAAEVCDDVDNDCDGKKDEDPTDGSTWYRDSDSDDYGDLATTRNACSKPVGYVADSTDCNDGDFNIYPGAPEQCDGISNDCDAEVDEDVVTSTYYADTDGDTYGDSAVSTTGCIAPSGYVSRAEDCDDSTSAVSPDATEICNTIDDDCDGSIDEDTSDGLTYYEDSDGDGYGTEDSTVSVCEGGSVPATYLDVSGDCDDTLDSINPSATEICDEIDNNCDGSIDEGFDLDGDGIADCEAGTTTGSDTTGSDTTGTDTTGSSSSGETTTGGETTSGSTSSSEGSETSGGSDGTDGGTGGSTDVGTETTGGETTGGAETGADDAGGGVTTGSESSGTETTGSETTGSETTGSETTGSDTTGTTGGVDDGEDPSETPETTGGAFNLSVEGGGCSLRF